MKHSRGQLDMVRLDAGSTDLRDDRTGRRWTIALRPFLILRHPVTQKLYADVTGEWPSSRRGDALPVETVSWFDAARFCNRLSAALQLSESYRFGQGPDEVEVLDGATGYRLPSEAEWAFACRAGTSGPRYGTVDDIAWFASNSGGRSQPVGLKAPNPWGLHDMLGNVWEWCSDQYDPSTYGSYRTFKGGGWADGPRGCLVTNRRRSHPTFKIDDLGFRITRSV